MKRCIVILVLSWCTASGFAQLNLNIDSLKNIISADNKEDTILVNRLLEISIAYTYDKPDSGIYYANSALELSQKLGYTDGETSACVWLYQGYWVLGDYSQSMQYTLQALRLFRQMKDADRVILMGNAFGDIYNEMGDYKQALRYFFEVRKLFEERGYALALSNEDIYIADAYLTGNRIDSAMFFAKRGFAKNRELRQDWTYAALVLGNVYAKTNQFDSALNCYRSAFESTNKINKIDIKNGIATIYRKQNQQDSCRFYAKIALDSAQVIHYRKGAMRASELLSWGYEKINPVEAIHYYKISMEIKDSLYNREKFSRVNNLFFGEKQREQELQAAQVKYQNSMRMYSLLAVVGFFLLIALFLWRSNRHRQKAYATLQKQKHETDNQKTKAQNALEELKSTQAQLIQSEKMASLGELTAGIAHEIQNPLNFVNNFSEISTELVDEMNEEIDKGNTEDAKLIAQDLKKNLKKINHHGKRAGDIVKGMLQHSRSGSGVKELTDINALADEYFRLAYHGLRAKDKSFNATMKPDYDETIGKINIIPQDIGRVILNLINNAFYVVDEKRKQNQNGYEPTVSLSSKKIGDKVLISVKDNGPGIPQTILDKIFQPFFTTKPTGQGTGLGLSLSYDIVKAHGGELRVETKEGEGAEFIISLPG
ncbi:MAG: ATP-binding protein [Chitinophagaceae bacterium]|nr:ATP-binding protein [Chitinophagaceae bacterium]